MQYEIGSFLPPPEFRSQAADAADPLEDDLATPIAIAPFSLISTPIIEEPVPEPEIVSLPEIVSEPEIVAEPAPEPASELAPEPIVSVPTIVSVPEQLLSAPLKEEVHQEADELKPKQVEPVKTEASAPEGLAAPQIEAEASGEKVIAQPRPQVIQRVPEKLEEKRVSQTKVPPQSGLSLLTLVLFVVIGIFALLAALLK